MPVTTATHAAKHIPSRERILGHLRKKDGKSGPMT
jgi:hypothetical protein